MRHHLVHAGWAALLLSGLVAGCGDALYAVRSSGMLPIGLDVSCISRSLASNPDGADARLVEPVRTIPLSTGSATYTWAYGERSSSYIRIRREPGHWAFENTRTYLGDGAREFGMFRIKPVMQRVNAALEADCGLVILEQSELGV